ncbi:ethylene receptor [Olea europaea subsp. europaea]|uniref:Ethylene receptor n=1 Tax=Olea europaea subsp. europaea TaxID=158383 RepID=A0A8S0RZ45_OLEEU|nr:ethylene receptor [Olea europaea subsp. europaea]
MGKVKVKVLNLIKPLAFVNKLSITLSLSSNLLEYAIDDEKRLMQVLLSSENTAPDLLAASESPCPNIPSPSPATLENNTLLAAIQNPGNTHHRTTRSKNNIHKNKQLSDDYVKDTGLGINPQDVPNLFTKFAQSQPLATKNFSSIGIGLAICKRFVNLMEGEIWIESGALGKGNYCYLYHETWNFWTLPFVPSVPRDHMLTNFSGLKVFVMDEKCAPFTPCVLDLSMLALLPSTYSFL